MDFSAAQLETAGTALVLSGRADLSVRFFRAALAREPVSPRLMTKLSGAYRMTEQLGTAEDLIRRAINFEQTAQRMTARACTVRQQNRLRESEDILRAAIDFDPTFAESASALAGWLFQDWVGGDTTAGILEEALERIDQAIVAAPKEPDYRATRCSILNLLGRYDDWAAEADYWQRRFPGHYAMGMQRAMSLLHHNDLRNGLPMLARYADRSPRLLELSLLGSPQWQPNSPPGPVDVVLAHGVGDSIQYARYFRLAAEHGAEVRLVAKEPEKRLMARAPGVSAVIDLEDATAGRHATGLSLIAAYTTSDDTIPPCPYLTAYPEEVAAWCRRLYWLGPHGSRKVGLCWRGNPQNEDDSRRSFRLADMAPLFDAPGVTFVSIQHGNEHRAELAGTPVLDLGDEFQGDDFAGKAAALSNLDLVISCDSSMNHLAGALGRPTWLALNFGPYYLWGSGRDTTPWYPTCRIFRQSVPGRWDDVFGAMARRLDVENRDRHLAG